MNQRLENYLRLYRDRFGAAGCRADQCQDRAIVDALRAVQVQQARRWCRGSLGWAFYRQHKYPPPGGVSWRMVDGFRRIARRMRGDVSKRPVNDHRSIAPAILRYMRG
jgi:hypothetical protein